MHPKHNAHHNGSCSATTATNHSKRSNGTNGSITHRLETPEWDAHIPIPTLGRTAASALVFLLAVSCFIISHDADFVFDDSEAILNNKDLRPDTSIVDLFSHDFWGSRLASKASHKSYRPLTVLTFRLNYFLAGGYHPWGFHVVNILLHGLVSVLALRVFSILFGRLRYNSDGHVVFTAPRAALLAAILFAVHPVHSEAVAGVVGRADLLCAVCFLLSFLCYVKACHKDVSAGYLAPVSHSSVGLALSMLLCALSVLFKEQGITVIGICSAYDIIVLCRINLMAIFSRRKEEKADSPTHNNKKAKQNDAGWLRLLLQRHLLLFVSAVAILVTRWRVMGSAPPTFQVVDNPHSFVNGTILRGLNYNYLYSLNGWLLLNPWWLCFDWSMGCVPVVATWTDERLAAVVVFWVVLGALLITALTSLEGKNGRLMTMGLALMIVPFLPATNLFFRVGFVVAERVLYLPSLGFSVLVVLGVRQIAMKFRCKEVLQVALVLLVGTHMMRCVQRSNEWRTEKQLFQSGATVCPSNAKVHYNIGKILGDTGDAEAAIAKYRQAIGLYPEYDQAMNNLANILKDSGDLVEAEGLLQRAVDIRLDFAAAWMNLGIVQAALKKNASAEESYLNAMRHRKKYPDCWYNLGNLYLEQMRHEEALAAWGNATKQKPKHINAWSNMIILLDNLGLVKEAEQVAHTALRYLPNEPSLYYNLANCLGKASQYEESERYFLKAIAIKPHDPTYHSNLGVLYHRWDKKYKAEKSYLRALELNPKMHNTRDNLDMLRKKMTQKMDSKRR